MPSITFSEEDANVLFQAVYSYVKNNRWDPSNPSEWECLKQLKDIEQRLTAFLDGDDPPPP